MGEGAKRWAGWANSAICGRRGLQTTAAQADKLL